MSNIWEVYTIGGGEPLVAIFNGVAAITKGNEFVSMMKISAIASLIWLIFESAFRTNIKNKVVWLVSFLIIYNVLFLPKATIQVVDRINNGLKAATIDNVPFGLAAFASLSSTVGDKLTSVMESNFSLPNDLLYHKTGMIMGSKLLRMATKVQVSNSNLVTSLNSFMKQCVFYDLLLNRYSFDDFKNSPNVWNFVTVENSPSVARSFVLTVPNNIKSDKYRQIVTCNQGAPILTEALLKETDTVLTKLAPRLFPSMDNNIAKTLLISALPVSHQQIMNLSSTASDILQQNMMINAIDHALIDMSASSNAVASLQAYAQARADSQVSASYDATARQAEKWVPLLKVVFQALYYGTFPLIFLVMLMPMGVSVLRSYFIGFIWLESWGPLYAILNRLMTASAADATKAATMLDGGTHGIALINQRGIDAVNADIANIAGSMAMAIPFLLPVIMGGAKAFSGLSTSMLAVPQNAATHAAQEAVTGNISYGNSSVNNHSFDNVSALKKSSSAYIDSGRVQLENSDGGKTSINADGSVVLDQSGAFSNLPGAQIDTSSSEASELRNQASQSINMANDQSVASTMSKASAFDLTAQAITNHSFSKTSGDDYRSSMTTSQSDAFSKINEVGESFAKQNNISKDNAIKILAGVSASGSKSLGGGKGSSGIMNTVLGAVGLNAGLDISGSTTKSDLISKAQNYAEKHDLKNAFEVASSAAYNKSFAMTDSNGNTLNDNIASSLSDAHRLEESSRSNYQRADSLNSSASNVESHSVNNRANEQQLFKNWLAKQNYGGKELGESGARDLLNSNTRQKQSALNSFVKRYKEENLSPGILNPNLPVLGSDIYDSPQSRSLENKYLNNSQIMRDENNQQIKNNHKINADGITTVHVQSLDKKIDHSNLEQVVFDEIRTNQSTIYNESTKPPTLKKEVNEKLDKGLFKSASDSVLDSVNIFKNNGPISSNNTTKDSSSKQDSELVDITDIVAANNLQNTAPNNNQQLENRHNSNKNSTTTAHVESVDKKIDHSDLEQGVPDTIRTNKSIIYNESEKPQTLTNEVNEKLDKGSFESTSDSVLDSVNIFNSGGPVNKANTAKGSSSKQDSQLVDTTDIVAANNLQNTVPVPMMQNSAVHLGGFKEDFRSSGKAPEGDNISNDLANIFSNNAHTQKEPELKIDIKKPKGNKGK